MNQADKQRFYKLVSDVLAYYRQDTSEFAMSVWWEGCSRFEYEQVAKAMTAHATDPDKGQFAPKIADIVRLLGGTKVDRALREWSRVHSAMSSVGAYTDVDFQDPATHAVIEHMGGWPKFCRTEIKDLSYLQHQFCTMYKSFEGLDVESKPLIGDRSPNEMYLKRGLPVPKPRVIEGGKPAPVVGIASQILKALQ